ncbi:MAG: hypothetical protein MUC87_00740 [Bacteroidia bacterium]|jgi:hypothetical protein|nr:hypothetical protein [Bacteroidia bacterium]
MKVELIPVIEITSYDQEVQMPEHGPYWKFPNDWENYHRLSNIKAGYSNGLKPYAKASSFYRVSEISDVDIMKAIEREIERQQTEEKNGVEDLVCSFNGGYVLKIDNEDIYFPQCCCGLDDIREWEDLANGQCIYFSIGHPVPHVTEKNGAICFDFVNTQLRESFVPPVIQPTIEIEKAKLMLAVQKAKNELQIFADRLKAINQRENLNIPDLDKILIWGVDNY